jgi:tetratricopeptide (TPR) repeat protein
LGADVAHAQGKSSKILVASDGDVAKNLDDLTQGVARKPDDAVAWRDLGIAQCRLGRYAEAAEALDRAARQDDLDDDFYLAVYQAVTAEMLGEYARAADLYDAAAKIDTKVSDELYQRAGNLRARSLVAAADPDGSFAQGPHTLALLPPVDLGGDAADLGPVLAAVLELGLEQARVDVLTPADTERWLAADGRGVADFDDPNSRDRVARNLARKGVEAVLACTFLHLPTGELHFRFALIRVSEDGAADTEAIAAEVGDAGAELTPLRASIAALWTALAVQGAPAAVALPASLDAARHYADGLQQLRDGRSEAAAKAFCAARDLAPDVAPIVGLCSQMAQLQVRGDEPLAVSFDNPVALVTEAVSTMAKRQLRSDRRFDDL